MDVESRIELKFRRRTVVLWLAYSLAVTVVGVPLLFACGAAEARATFGCLINTFLGTSSIRLVRVYFRDFSVGAGNGWRGQRYRPAGYRRSITFFDLGSLQFWLIFGLVRAAMRVLRTFR